MLTQRGTVLLGSAVLCWLVGRLLGIAELYVIAASAGACVAFGLVAVRLSSATVAARRTLPVTRLLHGGSEEVLVELRNANTLPTATLLVADPRDPALGPPTGGGADRASEQFVVPALRPRQRVGMRYRIHGGARGHYTIGPLEVRARDPLGVSERRRRYAATDDVLVYPRIEALPSGLRSGTQRGGGSADTRRLHPGGDEFHAIREYVHGDDLRLIHWPSTARRGKPLVRQNEEALQASATVLCDARLSAHVGRGERSTLERGISASASIIWHLVETDHRVRLVTDGTARPTAEHTRESMLDRLATLEPSRHDTLLAGLRSLRGISSGLLVVVLAPPPPGEDPRTSPSVRALASVRGFATRIAIVLDGGGRHGPRALETARLLAESRWRTETLGIDAPLAPPWRRLTGRPARAAVSTAAGPS